MKKGLYVIHIQRKMKKIKVILLISDLGMGGAENITINIAKYADKTQYDVTVVSMFSADYCVDKYKEIVKNYHIPVIFLNKKPGLDISIIFKLMSVLKSEKPDVVHTHRYSCVYALLPEIFCRISGRMHTVHNMAEREIPGLYRKLMKLAYHFFNVIPIAINEEVQKSIEVCYDIPEAKVPIVYNGVDIKKFYKIDKEDKEIVLINVGRFSDQKNHRLLIKCLYEVLKKDIKVKLYLIGDGELKEKIQEDIARYGIEKNVVFTGNVSNVEDYLAKADIFVMTSDYEGLPLSAIEAMAAGLPIISTRAGGVVNLIQDQVNGILVDIGDEKEITEAILDLCQNFDKRKQLGDQAKYSVKKYSVENMVHQYEELYKQLGKNK